jgi:adenine-specific DNA-methyltransferase
MEKLKLHTPDLTQANIDKLAQLFPNCVAEARGADGVVKRSIDFDQLRQELSTSIVEGPKERYQLNWPGKREALLTANAPIAKTLRPCREESVDFDTTQNLFIEGDNLDALKLLQEIYLNKVKLIYIDPPYNTRNDFIYDDDFAVETEEYFRRSNQKDDQGQRLIAITESNGRRHSDWLSMMYSRLKLARNLLAEDGVILISIDENEFPNLRKVCEEVFGDGNFAGEIVWKNSSKNDQAYISMQHEYILCFVKNKGVNLGIWDEKKDGLEEIYKAFDSFKSRHGANWDEIHKEALSWYKQFPESNPISGSKHYNWMDSNGVYFAADISGPNYGQYRYDVTHPVTGQVCKEPASGWRFPEETMKQRIRDGLVHFGKDHTTVPNNKTYIKNTEYQSLTSVKYKDGRVASNSLAALMGGNYFTNPKDPVLLAQLFKALKLGVSEIALDFFAGSGSTADAVMALNAEDGLNRQFILVQLPATVPSEHTAFKAGFNTIADICKERLRRAGTKIKHDGMGKPAIAKLDTGFRVLKIDSSNMKEVFYSPDAVSQDLLSDQVNNIREDRTSEDLLFQVLLDWGVDLALPIAQENIDGKSVYFVDGNALAACFETGITEEFVKLLAKRTPLRAVFRDAGFANDSVKINVEQIFKLMSPSTEVKTI